MAQANKGSRHTSFGLWIRRMMLLFTVRSQTDAIIALGSIACVDADIVKRQIGRPHMSPVTASPQSDGDRKFFLAKDLCDSAFSSEPEPDPSMYHRDSTKPHTQFGRSNRNPGSSDRRHNSTPIGILAE
jgi:hypothetical protein